VAGLTVVKTQDAHSEREEGVESMVLSLIVSKFGRINTRRAVSMNGNENGADDHSKIVISSTSVGQHFKALFRLSRAALTSFLILRWDIGCLLRLKLFKRGSRCFQLSLHLTRWGEMMDGVPGISNYWEGK
jgi:hypothetical protein